MHFSQRTAPARAPSKEGISKPQRFSRVPTSPPPFITGERIYLFALSVIWLAVAGAAWYGGHQYYRLPLQERPYSELHDLYKPSGLMGHGMGIAGSLMMIVGVVMYALRKRVHALHSLGKLKHWLQFHIFLCTLGPFLVVLHTAFRIGGIISIAFWSMVIVVTSGVLGRYVFARIPKTLNGQFLSKSALRSRMAKLAQTLEHASGLSAEEVHELMAEVSGRISENTLGALWQALRWDLVRRKRTKRVERRMALHEAPYADRRIVHALIREYMKLERQTALLTPFRKLFSYWHILHLPLAAVMFFIMFVHIVVAALFGYAWIF